MSAALAVDIVIVGGGAAGIAAARAATAAGARRIVLVSAGPGASAMTAGWVAAGSVALDLGALAWLPDAGLRAMGAYAFASQSGALAPAISGLPSLLDLGDLPDGGALGVVDLVAGPAWSADLVARSLATAVGREARVVVPPSGAPRGETARELARELDAHGIVDGLAASLRDAARGCSALLFPPVLGFVRDGVAQQLASFLGVTVGEAGGGPSDPPALRLARALDRAVPASIERASGRASVRAGERGRARVEAGGRAWDAGAVVLATGGLAGGGLAFDGALTEPCAGAPVWLAGSSSAAFPLLSADRGMDPFPLFAPDAQGRVEALCAGVRLVGLTGRVTSANGTDAMHPWLFAAGGVLCGGQGPYGHALADALASGGAAGERAARHALGQ